jgi:DNA topoisomerase-1
MVKKDKILVVVESPAKAKTISKYLGKEYVVRASAGHIFDLSTGGKHNFGIDIDKGFIPKYTVIPDKKDKLKAIMNAAKSASSVYLATDDDREGEAIAWHLAEALKSVKVPIKRIKFREITKKGISDALKNIGDLDRGLFDAQQARRVIDRIVGFSVSPLLIHKFGPKLSAGRVQSVAVRIVVDREREIEAFIPEEYWNITATLAKKKELDDSFVAKYSKKVTDEKTAKKIKADLDGDDYNIKSLDESERKRNPPPPLITSSLAKSAAVRYKFTTARTMKAAQSLYEAGMITYMRTDSYRCSGESIMSCRGWLSENGYDCPEKPNFYAVKKKGAKNTKKAKAAAQDAHEAIRPTNVKVTPQNIYSSEDEQKVYRIVWERFVASQMLPALYDNVNAVIETTSGHQLKASGRTLKYAGWLEIAHDLEKESNNDVKLPKLKVGENVILVKPKVVADQKFTKPPPRYSEATLIDELKKQGIGRPSTFAAIMSKITSRNYVERKAGAFCPTDLGKKIVDDLVKYYSFMNINYTANMEQNLDKIADGDLKYLDMLNDFYEPFQGELRKSEMSSNTDYGFECPKCGGKMVLNHGIYGYYLACYDYPKKCKGTISCNIVDDKPVPKESFKSEVVSGVSCPKCKSDMVKRDGKFGPFYACTKYPKCKGTRKAPYGKKCPQCGCDLYATLWKGKDVLFCMGYPSCKYSEDLPKGTIADPKKFAKKKKISKKIRKIIG